MNGIQRLNKSRMHVCVWTLRIFHTSLHLKRLFHSYDCGKKVTPTSNLIGWNLAVPVCHWSVLFHWISSTFTFVNFFLRFHWIDRRRTAKCITALSGSQRWDEPEKPTLGGYTWGKHIRFGFSRQFEGHTAGKSRDCSHRTERKRDLLMSASPLDIHNTAMITLLHCISSPPDFLH